MLVLDFSSQLFGGKNEISKIRAPISGNFFKKKNLPQRSGIAASLTQQGEAYKSSRAEATPRSFMLNGAYIILAFHQPNHSGST